MTKKARSARGDLVDFDLLAIKQQLATTPVPVSVNQRRRFIDEKDGVKTRENFIVSPQQHAQSSSEPSPLDIAAEAALASAKASATTE